MLAGTGGDCGKTLVSLGLAAAWRREGVPVAPFKKGPDYIDPAWLTLAAGRVTRNLDTWMMGPEAAFDSFVRHACCEGVNLIEANRGLYDGENAQGSHSSAELSKLLKTPIILVLPAIKTTRTVAAIALGLRSFDPQVEIAGVVLNQIATSRQESVIRSAVEHDAGLPVVGAIPRVKGGLLPSRHLGLVTPEEHSRARQIIDAAADIIQQSVDLARLRGFADNAAPLETLNQSAPVMTFPGGHLRIGFFKSPAFTFYYPENLEAIDQCAATRIPIDPLANRVLPVMDALYIGGGFPETHAAALAGNAAFRDSLRRAVHAGLPVWAECGGLMFLSKTVCWSGALYPMAGVFPADVILGSSPAGHGYEEVVVDRPNPFVEVGTVLRGHEFHYSRIETGEELDTAFEVRRGTGLGNGRDGVITKNILASYLHIHSLGTPEWIRGLIRAADSFHNVRAGISGT